MCGLTMGTSVQSLPLLGKHCWCLFKFLWPMSQPPYVSTVSTLFLCWTEQQFSYELENPYLAIDAKTDYYTLPAEAEVSLCVATHGKWCRLAQPMYTVDTSRHCVLALFLKQNALITKFCTIIRHRSNGVYAAQLQPCIWVVSLAKSMLLRTECVMTG